MRSQICPLLPKQIFAKDNLFPLVSGHSINLISLFPANNNKTSVPTCIFLSWYLSSMEHHIKQTIQCHLSHCNTNKAVSYSSQMPCTELPFWFNNEVTPGFPFIYVRTRNQNNVFYWTYLNLITGSHKILF